MLRNIGRISIFLALFLGLGVRVFSKAEEFDEHSSDPNNRYAHMQIRIDADRMIFQEHEPLNIKVTVLDSKNSEILTVFPKKEYFSYYIEVYSQEGISLPERDEYFANRFNDIQAEKLHPNSENFREIQLSSKEIIGEIVNLTDLFDLSVGRYLVRVKFYPKTVLFDPMSFIYSPFIQIFVEPEKEKAQKAIKMQEDWEKDRQNLKTPEDSVMAFFDAKKEGNWDKFFYVLDLSRLINIFGEFNESYERGTSDQKDSILQDFQKYLQDVNASEDIRSVELKESIMRENQAIIKVQVKTALHRRLLSREYIFKLEKEGHWVITAYTVLIR